MRYTDDIGVNPSFSSLFLPSAIKLSFRFLLQWGLFLLEGETQYILKQGKDKTRRTNTKMPPQSRTNSNIKEKRVAGQATTAVSIQYSPSVEMNVPSPDSCNPCDTSTGQQSKTYPQVKARH